MQHILMVDDDPFMGELAKGFLSGPETEVHGALSGEEAVRAMQSRRFDLVVTDIDMGKLDGLSLIRHIRSSATHASVPVLVVSGRKDLHAIDMARSLGASSFVSKPVNWRLLPYKVRELLTQTEARSVA
ncbi:response regulator [Alsobacter metallidurans]|nr:response regulator [Alsobacter metallidurans]